MSEFDHRVDWAARWFGAHVVEDPEGGAGWGWVPDVPPNPQNTAEVVCALTSIGRPIPRGEEAIELVRRKSVAHAAHGNWAFGSLIDISWRLRGLRCVIDDPADVDVRKCVEALLSAQLPGNGGWSLAGTTGQPSVTATCLSLLGLLGLEGSEKIESAVQGGLSMLINAVLEDDPQAERIYASAQIVSVMSRPDVVSLGGQRGERAREKALDRVAAGLRRGRLGIQEETFRRGKVTDIWRHMTLCLALTAKAQAAPDRIFSPAFRKALIEMLDLQEDRDDNINFGGFRTSQEGFVTSYATTQALHALAAIDSALSGQVNPGSAFDLLCRSDGSHHSDPQDVIKFAGRTVTMNSWAGALMLAIGLVAAISISALTIAVKDDLGKIASGLVIAWGAALLAFGAFAFATVRWPEKSNGWIAAGIFSGFTALVLPIIFFVFT